MKGTKAKTQGAGRPLTDVERHIAQKAFIRQQDAQKVLREAMHSAAVATDAWNDTQKLLTGGDPSLRVNPQTWRVEPVTQKQNGESGER